MLGISKETKFNGTQRPTLMDLQAELGAVRKAHTENTKRFYAGVLEIMAEHVQQTNGTGFKPSRNETREEQLERVRQTYAALTPI